jgi:hypothetical protein
MAHGITDAEAKRAMLMVAENYEKIANRAEAVAADLRNVGSSDRRSSL